MRRRARRRRRRAAVSRAVADGARRRRRRAASRDAPSTIRVVRDDRAARRGPMCTVFGIVEEAGGAQFYNAAVAVRDGRVVHVHRKINLATYGQARRRPAFRRGPAHRVDTLRARRRAGVRARADLRRHLESRRWCILRRCRARRCCWRRSAPALEAVGDEFDNPGGWDVNLRFHALTYGMPVVMANRVGRKAASRSGAARASSIRSGTSSRQRRDAARGARDRDGSTTPTCAARATRCRRCAMRTYRSCIASSSACSIRRCAARADARFPARRYAAGSARGLDAVRPQDRACRLASRCRVAGAPLPARPHRRCRGGCSAPRASTIMRDHVADQMAGRAALGPHAVRRPTGESRGRSAGGRDDDRRRSTRTTAIR